MRISFSAESNEGVLFAISLSRSLGGPSDGPIRTNQYNAELLINARETTDVTIASTLASEVVTVTGGSSLRHPVDQSMRVVNGIEGKRLVSLYHSRYIVLLGRV